MNVFIRLCLSWVCLLCLGFDQASAEGAHLKVAVTTSFQNSGLADILLPAIKQDTGLSVDLIVVGSGQAITLGRNGDVDAILVHSRTDEDAFIADGLAVHRREIMYNDFVLIGPRNDPANVSEASDILAAIERIKAIEALFVSRGDYSGTDKAEKRLWIEAGFVSQNFASSWYRETGSGMGAALNVASGLDGYILADRASWLNFGNRGNLALLYQGGKQLFNQYAFLPVNPKVHPHVQSQAARTLEAWLISDKAQAMINAYTINGEQLFFANAK